MSRTVSGKALLVITRMNSEHVPYDIEVYIQSCSEEHYAWRDEIMEAFSCAECDVLPLPDVCEKLRHGDQITLAVTYVYTMYGPDYWGEYSSYLEYPKVTVLRRRPWTKRDDRRWYRAKA